MTEICPWCNGEFPQLNGSFCPDCRKMLQGYVGISMKEYLDSLEFPVLLITPDVLVASGNRKALDMLGKETPEICGRAGGDVIECVHSRKPGGCGKQVHCKSCTIRRMVKDTLATGNSHVEVPAYADTSRDAVEKRVSFLISTQKVGESVLLIINHAG